MDANRFHSLARSLTSLLTRRNVLHGLAATGLGLAAFPGWPGDESAVEAKKKRKKNKQKHKQPPQVPQSPGPPFNEFGCLDVGQPCQGDSTLCCSGICDPGTSTCIPHNSGVCFEDTDTCTLGHQFPCSFTNPLCTCLLTSGNAGFCGDFKDFDPNANCRFCSQDTDCQEEFGAEAACVLLRGGCSPMCPSTGRTACVRPCPE